jgi:hypothetical protein
VTSVFIFAILLTVFLAVVVRNTASFCVASHGGYSQTKTADEPNFLPESTNLNEASVERG